MYKFSILSRFLIKIKTKNPVYLFAIIFISTWIDVCSIVNHYSNCLTLNILPYLL